jgi:hypothetical protein
MKSTNAPAYPSYKFPLTYGSQWSGTYTTTTTYNGTQMATSSTSYTDVVDGWGMVITPDGSFPCLRLKNFWEISVSGTVTSAVYYFFIGKTQTYATIISSASGSSGVTYTKTVTLTGVKEKQPAPATDFALSQNYPDPFNPSTTITYRLPSNSFVVLKVTDILGREVQSLVNERQAAGTHSIVFSANNLPSGVYFYTLQAGMYHSTKKFLLLK